MDRSVRDEKGRWAGSIGEARDAVPTPSPVTGVVARLEGSTAGVEPLDQVVARFHVLKGRRGVERLESSVWVDGVEVVVYDARPADRGDEVGTVVFLHGWGLGPRSYAATVDAMVARGYRVVSPALPGFGGSDPLPGDVPRQEVVRRTADHVRAALLEYDSPRPWRIAGHSFGGGVAASLAASAPGDVSSLLLLSPIGGDTAPGSWVRALMSLGGEIRHSSVDRVRDALPAFARDLGGVLSTGIAAKSTDLSTPLAEAARSVPVTMAVADGDRVTPVGRLGAVPGVTAVDVSGSHGWLLSGKGPEVAAELLARSGP